ncbi:MAG: class I SAM-dependent methyltransferase family protein, partial [Thiobacillus sp.]
QRPVLKPNGLHESRGGSVKLYVPFARPALMLQHKLRGEFFVNSYVKAKFLTHDPERIASYDSDPLISRPIAVNILLGLYEAAERVVSDAAAITVPTQLLISGSDWVVHHKPQHAFFQRLGSVVKEKHELPGFYHDTLGEKDRHIAVDLARSFITRLFDSAQMLPSLLNAHQSGYTKTESDVLAAPLPTFSARGLYWGMTRLGLKLGGWFSAGIKLGHQTGFDSGSTLDYVYRNEPTGLTWIGRLIDAQYLGSIGWRGIRQRKIHNEVLLQTAFARLRETNRPVRVLDIAAGHGRYVLESIGNGDTRPDEILLRDYSDINVRDGNALIERKGLGDVARFIKADAFDRESIAQVTPKPTVGIVSGLYELFGDNAMIERSLSGLSDAIAPGGYLVYTGQPWHPQLELIARALTSHRGGEAWVMRRRTQGEMDQLVARAGFKKIEQRIDAWGIFTVSLAQRI